MLIYTHIYCVAVLPGKIVSTPTVSSAQFVSRYNASIEIGTHAYRYSNTLYSETVWHSLLTGRERVDPHSFFGPIQDIILTSIHINGYIHVYIFQLCMHANIYTNILYNRLTR